MERYKEGQGKDHYGLLANSRVEVASWVLPGRFQRDYSPACLLILGFQVLDLCNNTLLLFKPGWWYCGTERQTE